MLWSNEYHQIDSILLTEDGAFVASVCIIRFVHEVTRMVPVGGATVEWPAIMALD